MAGLTRVFWRIIAVNMGKHKVLFWSFVGVWVVLLAGGGVFAWHVKENKDKKMVLNSSALDDQTGQAQSLQSTDGSSQSQTIQNTNGSGVTINGNGQNSQGSPSVAGTNTQNSSDQIAKLLDPSTFGQYDTYKDKSSAYFIDLQAGDGTALSSGHKAAVYYKGWLTNGQLFDQSQKGSDGNLQPFVFTQGQHQVIAGWEEALDGMKVGGVLLLIVPPSVGYGAQGQGSIPGNAVLIFQVQLGAVQ